MQHKVNIQHGNKSPAEGAVGAETTATVTVPASPTTAKAVPEGTASADAAVPQKAATAHAERDTRNPGWETEFPGEA